MRRVHIHATTLPWTLLILAVSGLTYAFALAAGLTDDPLVRDIVKATAIVAGITWTLSHLLPMLAIDHRAVRVFGLPIRADRVLGIALVERPVLMRRDAGDERCHALVFRIRHHPGLVFDASFETESLDTLVRSFRSIFGDRFSDHRADGPNQALAGHARVMWLRENLIGIVGLAACVPLIALL